MVADDLASGRRSEVVTRFPPEPNGFLHIGHAKAITISFGIAQQAAAGELGPDVPVVPARTHLRFDDTNPAKEEQRYIDAIKEDIRWLGFDWGEHEYHASDYFGTLYDWARALIEHGHAYVDDQSADEMRANRGTLTTPGSASPYRDRPPDESLDLFARMKAGEFPDGSRVLRAKIDMASPNLNLRDPAMYRILHATHPRTGDDWCIYPMYDWAHGQSDWIEGVTHSLCSLEFEAHRPLYDWFIDTLIKCGAHPRKHDDGAIDANDRPRQTEFNRLNVTHTVMSKRFLRTLVEENYVSGWDDPRMPTLRGMRRRGYPAAALRRFIVDAGLSKRNQVMDLGRLEGAVRDDLNKTALRRMAVLDPLKVVITNWPDGEVDQLDATNNPEDDSAGVRQVDFSGELYIEREDFMIDPPRKFFRLGPGREVRLRYAYWITCTDYETDADGNVTLVRCTYDPQTRGGDSPPPDTEGKVRKVKGTLHWVSAAHAVDATVRLYDTLLNKDDDDEAEPGDAADEAASDFTSQLNPDSLVTLTGCKVEPALGEAEPGGAGKPVQFERKGYYVRDADGGQGDGDALVFNRTVGLRDSWAKAQKK